MLQRGGVGKDFAPTCRHRATYHCHRQRRMLRRHNLRGHKVIMFPVGPCQPSILCLCHIQLDPPLSLLFANSVLADANDSGAIGYQSLKPSLGLLTSSTPSPSLLQHRRIKTSASPTELSRLPETWLPVLPTRLSTGSTTASSVPGRGNRFILSCRKLAIYPIPAMGCSRSRRAATPPA